MTYKCVLPPDQSSYTVTDGQSVDYTQLEGGKGRYRTAILNPSSNVTVQWTTDGEGYEYLRAFYQTCVSLASSPFLIDLIMDNKELTEHEAYFIPNTFKLSGVSGLTYIVSTQLEVIPKTPDFISNSTHVAMWELFGTKWRYYEDVLHTLVNIEWPEAL